MTAKTTNDNLWKICKQLCFLRFRFVFREGCCNFAILNSNNETKERQV